MNYGDYRSARDGAQDGEGWTEAWRIAGALPKSEAEVALLDWWRVADLEKVAEVASWNRDTPILCMDDATWKIKLGGITLLDSALYDFTPLLVPYTKTEAYRVLPFWEEWAADHAPTFLDAPRMALQTAEIMWVAEAARASKTAERIPQHAAKWAAQAAWAWGEAAYAQRESPALPRRATQWAAQAAHAAAWAIHAAYPDSGQQWRIANQRWTAHVLRAWCERNGWRRA